MNLLSMNYDYGQRMQRKIKQNGTIRPCPLPGIVREG